MSEPIEIVRDWLSNDQLFLRTMITMVNVLTEAGKHYMDDHSGQPVQLESVIVVQKQKQSGEKWTELKRTGTENNGFHDNIWICPFPTWCKNPLYISRGSAKLSRCSSGFDLNYENQYVLKETGQFLQNCSWAPDMREHNVLLKITELIDLVKSFNSYSRSSTTTVFDLIEKQGQKDYIGEKISIKSHLIRSAEIAQARGYPNYMITACLFHDVGHLLDAPQMVKNGLSYGSCDHNEIGADYLTNLGFNHLVTQIVRRHVDAKRYLKSKDNDYKVSEASQITLQFQGGPMTVCESHWFEKDPNFKMYVAIRDIEEESKNMAESVDSLEKFREIVEQCVVEP
jgi:2-amino-1-hydroxyethylphosphonate dioxygenase (glycine-forming)